MYSIKKFKPLVETKICTQKYPPLDDIMVYIRNVDEYQVKTTETHYDKKHFCDTYRVKVSTLFFTNYFDEFYINIRFDLVTKKKNNISYNSGSIYPIQLFFDKALIDKLLELFDKNLHCSCDDYNTHKVIIRIIKETFPVYFYKYMNREQMLHNYITMQGV